MYIAVFNQKIVTVTNFYYKMIICMDIRCMAKVSFWQTETERLVIPYARISMELATHIYDNNGHC